MQRLSHKAVGLQTPHMVRISSVLHQEMRREKNTHSTTPTYTSCAFTHMIQ